MAKDQWRNRNGVANGIGVIGMAAAMTGDNGGRDVIGGENINGRRRKWQAKMISESGM